MHTKLVRTIAAAFLTVPAFASQVTAPTGPLLQPHLRYKATLIAPLPGQDYNSPRGISGDGRIIGVAAPEAFHPLSLPVLVDPAGAASMPQAPSDSYNFLNSIGNDGTMTGTSGFQPYVWKDGVPQLLPALPGFFSGTAQDVNPQGYLCGSVGDTDFAGPRHVVWSSASSQPKVLTPLFPGNPSGQAVGINRNGQIAGTSGGTSGAFFAVRWDAPNQPPLKLGPLPGAMNSDATDMNDEGDVCGLSSSASGTTEAFLYRSATGELVGLGFLPGAELAYSEARGLNDRRQVVGAANAGPGVAHAFLWQAGMLYDLNDLVVESDPEILYLSSAAAINNHGQIAAEAAIGPEPQSGMARIVRLDPIL